MATGQVLHALINGSVALQSDLRAHALYLLGMHKPVLEHRLGDRPYSRSAGIRASPPAVQ